MTDFVLKRLRDVRRSGQALLMLVGIALLIIWASVGLWVLTWILAFAVNAEWSKAVGQWGHDFYSAHGWVQVCVWLAFISIIVLFIPAPRLRIAHDLEKERKEEEARVAQANNALVAQRHHEQAQGSWAQLMGIR